MSYIRNFYSFDFILLMVVAISVNGGGHFSKTSTFLFSLFFKLLLECAS